MSGRREPWDEPEENAMRAIYAAVMADLDPVAAGLVLGVLASAVLFPLLCG